MNRINFLALWVGTTCTLNCRNCCNLIPYLKARIFDAEKVLANIHYIASEISIELLQIQGGEPLTSHQLEQMITGLNGLPIENIELASNGTLVPSAEVLTAMKNWGGAARIGCRITHVSVKSRKNWWRRP